ncbi:sulfhydryl oxidase 2-like [Chiloscyllium punctatum]|uniref:sulfhydryl oxidase 2-like n=1 Tax=Chiloscyllium punctatum TaxID=137246 RepID=UPI003B634118
MAPCGPGADTRHWAPPLSWCSCCVTGHTARLYSRQEPVTILEADGVKGLFGNPSAAWVVEFYWSWGGPCVNSGATWKVLGPGGERVFEDLKTEVSKSTDLAYA